MGGRLHELCLSASIDFPAQIKSHSTRTQAAFAASLRSIPISEIRKAATRSSVCDYERFIPGESVKI